MPVGTFVIDHPATFTNAIFMGSGPKAKFGEERQDADANGQPKWLCSVAVTFAAQGAMKPQSEVLELTITGADPAASIPVGTPVLFDQLRVGINPPEKRDNGTIRGGRLWYSAAGLRSAVPARTRGES